MNRTTCKKIRNKIDELCASMPDVSYEEIERKQKLFIYPPGTQIPMDNPKIHLMPGQVGDVQVLVDQHQVVLGQCKRRFYQRLKRDIKRARRGY